jgi:hypothetical protein
LAWQSKAASGCAQQPEADRPRSLIEFATALDRLPLLQDVDTFNLHLHAELADAEADDLDGVMPRLRVTRREEEPAEEELETA